MLQAEPRQHSLLAYMLAMSGLRAHRYWRHYRKLRPLLAYPIEAAVRCIFDVLAHAARAAHDPLYRALRGGAVVWSQVPQRQPDSWRAEWLRLASDLKLLVGALSVLYGARRGLLTLIARREAELQAGADGGVSAAGTSDPSDGANDAQNRTDGSGQAGLAGSDQGNVGEAAGVGTSSGAGEVAGDAARAVNPVTAEAGGVGHDAAHREAARRALAGDAAIDGVG